MRLEPLLPGEARSDEVISFAGNDSIVQSDATLRNAYRAAKRLRHAVNKLRFATPVAHVYNPLDYAWAAHEAYLQRYANGKKRVLFLG